MASISRGRRYVLGYALAVIVGVLVICGCASISTFQSARTLKPGETQKGVGVTAGNPLISPSWGAGKSLVYPWPEFWLRKGLSENLDWGIKTWGLLLGGMVDLKYQFLSDESPWQVAGSLGFGVSHRLLELNLEGESYTFFDLHVPLFISRDFGEYSTFYISPKYIHKVVIGDNAPRANYSHQWNAFGAGLGISFHLNKKLSMMLEYNCMYEKGTIEGFTHNWAVGFGFNKQKE
ncbi:hypothetical protein ES705_02406 [subsurface metagenome]|nr:hypothetical protein [Clostridia bacterium]